MIAAVAQPRIFNQSLFANSPIFALSSVNRINGQSAKPRPQPNMEKTFHYDLSGKGAGESRVLTRSEQGDGKKRAGKTDPEQRTEQLVGVLNLRHVFVTGPMESGRGQYQDGGVNREREHERTGRV